MPDPLLQLGLAGVNIIALGIAVVWLWRRLNTVQDQRLADLTRFHEVVDKNTDALGQHSATIEKLIERLNEEDSNGAYRR